jgi:hypothetical protein
LTKLFFYYIIENKLNFLLYNVGKKGKKQMSQSQPQLSIAALQSAKDLLCEAEECGHNMFIPVFIIKHISALMSPTGQEINAPVQTFACAKCGHVNKDFIPANQ